MGKNTRLSSIYRAMKRRCYYSKDKRYASYGGRGIKICDEWLNPEIIITEKGRSSRGYITFKEWAISNGYKDNLTIDRIDVNKGYSPENCRWVDLETQANNTRRNKYVTYKGKTQTLPQWCRELKLDYNKIRQRIFTYHWSIDKAFEYKLD